MTLASRLKRLSDRLMRDVAHLYNQEGIAFEPRWYPLFRLLLTHEHGFSVAEAAARLGVSHPNVSQVATAMVKAGMLQREADPDDRRRTQMQLTDEGRAMAEQARPLWARLERTLHGTHGVGPLLNALTVFEASLDQESLRDRVSRAPTAVGGITVEPWFEEGRTAFLELNRTWIEAHFVLEPHDRELLEQPERHILEPGGEILLAKNAAGDVLGTVALIPEPDGWVELSKMAVDPQARGQGVGRLLMAAAARTCASRGWERVYLVTNSALVPALALYRAVGFVRVPLPPGNPYERADVRMEWSDQGRNALS